ncbi:MAG: hypothetical protein KDD42_06120 [Bdellovibrionales bacterium]|nr:hypothetical protein [Bdellovibrionales bacterium]
MQNDTSRHIPTAPVRAVLRPIAGSILLLALVVVLCRGSLRQLIWFGDEYQLLSELQNSNLLSWPLTVFAENFVPVFKFLWGAAVELSFGNYRIMLALNWLTHGLNIVILGVLLWRSGFREFSIWIALLLFGVPSTIVETLGWSVQWSAVLAVLFFLSALVLLNCRLERGGRSTPSLLILLLLLACCSAFSFSRGVLLCAVLAAYALISSLLKGQSVKSAILPCCAVLLPGLVSTIVIVNYSSGNHHGLSHMTPHQYEQLINFFLYFLCLNPFYNLFAGTEINLWMGALVCSFKFLLIAFALGTKRNNAQILTLLISLLLFDLGNALLVSVGRFHTGAAFALSSRYQYESLLCISPFAAIFFEELFSRIEGRRPIWRLKMGFILILAICLVHSWPRVLQEWGAWRGVAGRSYLQGSMKEPRWIGVPPWISPDTYNSLRARFNLH